MTAGPLDVAAWKQQLLVLGQSTSSAQIRLILYTMSARRLFETAMVSRAHYSVVAEFLAFLACNGIEEDTMSADGSETSDSGDSGARPDLTRSHPFLTPAETTCTFLPRVYAAPAGERPALEARVKAE
ncbi:hypothetical protein C8R47DRAFT_1065525 [Mycena vitilis]|nr:hypothetical protein C8R47DRAFT_1065525 [Mycena vitilis]